MHICHVNLAGGFSGGERQTVNLIRELAKRGIQQTLVARPGSRLWAELESIQSLGRRETAHFLLGHGKGDWDLVHCHDGKSVYWAWIESRLRKTPYVVTRRVDNPIGTGRLTSAAYGGASTVACLSSAIEAVVQQRLGCVDTVIIPSSFSGFPTAANAVEAIRQQYPAKRLVGQVGRLLKHKGYHITIEAARLLGNLRPDVQFIFLGEGPDEQWLKSQAQGLPNVSFLGHKDNVGDWLASLDVFVFPSLSEGLGSTILEAMQHHVPVVGAKAGGIPDLISDKTNGLLVSPGDPEALASAIQFILDNPEQAAALTDAAQAGLTAFSPASVAERYLDLYSATLQSQGGS